MAVNEYNRHFSGKEGVHLILPSTLKGRLTTGSVRTIPAHNIRASIGYLLMRMANFEYRSALGADTRIYEITVKPGDSLDKIAKAQGSTVDMLRKLNPTAVVLRSGQVLKCQKARLRSVVDTQGKGCSMCAVKLLGVCLAAYLPVSALAASTDPVPDERALREECSAFSQAGMRDCLAKKAENSQKALRQTEENVARTLSKWDKEKKYVSQARAKLTASNEDFAKYRDVQCAFASSLGGGAIGNAIDMRHLACIAELNDRRAAQLRDAVSDLPLK